ncbi:MAG: site-specific DNA-methyltransferase, partial [Candidatus Diapherotrites archaeon]|nr:site-specific DNA-methyltransferase [Candidatus Diapherotrites archaeon]
MDYEKTFYEAFSELFVGEKIEGEGGFVNLMKIKSKYFSEGILPELKRKVEEEIREFPEFRQELFEKLYSFFESFFSKNGCVYFVNTPAYKSIYEKVYTDDKDVMLFWKTHMLYYVKTDRLFKSLQVEVDGFKFFFDVSELEHKKNNEKRELIYSFKEKKEDGTIILKVLYSERGTRTKIEDILKHVNDRKLREETLEKAFKIFESQREVDYFINKNAREFLRDQFDLWMYQYVFREETKWSERRIKQLQALREIAYSVIEFIAQFENELVKIWNKPKFVLRSNYVISLDKIAQKNGWEVLKKLTEHKGWEEQIKEWMDLKLVEKKPDSIFESTLNGPKLKGEYRFLPIDTKYFKDLEYEILGLFDSLDKELDGWLIKSENYQALNTILPKFKEKVQTIYIDPPFNKEQDADYYYSVKYKDSTWATMLENRISLAKEFLKDSGSIFVRCDHNGNWIVRALMDEIFGRESFRNEIILQRGMQTRKAEKKLLNKTDSLFFYFKNLAKGYMIILEREKDHVLYFNETLKVLEKLISPTVFKEIEVKLKESLWMPFLSMPGEQKSKISREIFGVTLFPPSGRHWAFSQENLDIAIKQGTARLVCKNCKKVITSENEIEQGKCKNCKSQDFEGQIYSLYNQINDNWTDIPGYEQDSNFPTKNSEILLKRVIESTSNQGDIVMDFFLGSGTTCAVAHKLRRKWIGIEMGEHFYTIV